MTLGKPDCLWPVGISIIALFKRCAIIGEVENMAPCQVPENQTVPIIIGTQWRWSNHMAINYFKESFRLGLWRVASINFGDNYEELQAQRMALDHTIRTDCQLVKNCQRQRACRISFSLRNFKLGLFLNTRNTMFISKSKWFRCTLREIYLMQIIW